MNESDRALIAHVLELNGDEPVDIGFADGVKRNGSVSDYLRLVEPDAVEDRLMAEKQMQEISKTLGRPWVYFVRAGKSGPIKIGSSRSPLRRIAEIQSHQFVTLSILCICISENENDLHKEFADLRMRGEWFRQDVRLRDRIASLIRESRVSGSYTRIQ